MPMVKFTEWPLENAILHLDEHAGVPRGLGVADGIRVQYLT